MYNILFSVIEFLIRNSSTYLAMFTEKKGKKTHKSLYFVICLSWLYHFSLDSGKNLQLFET